MAEKTFNLMGKLITVLTATYNRAHLLPDLYHSLCRQTCKDFNWLIIDDGSNDGTSGLINEWLLQNHGFHISCCFVPNGGKNRAINTGMEMVKTPFVMIVDSDDYITDDAIAYFSERLIDAMDDNNLAGISGLRGYTPSKPLHHLSFKENDFVVANNLERKKFGLDKDACEIYKTELLRTHPFKVWEGEKFVPEEVVWNQFAIEGYSLRWYNKVTCIVRYQEEGLTINSLGLLKKNPMGYASMYKQRVLLSRSSNERFSNCTQLIAQSLLGGHPFYAFQSNKKITTILAYPFGCIIALRRIIQYAKI